VLSGGSGSSGSSDRCGGVVVVVLLVWRCRGDRKMAWGDGEDDGVI